MLNLEVAPVEVDPVGLKCGNTVPGRSGVIVALE